MYLIQIFLPLFDPAQKRFPHGEYEQVEQTLLQSFNGFTAYPRSPAKGLWENSEAQPVQDDLVVYEVMTGQIDRQWWLDLRHALEAQFQQEQLLIRASRIEVL